MSNSRHRSVSQAHVKAPTTTPPDDTPRASPPTAATSATTDELLSRSAELQRRLAEHEAVLRGEERK
ncbi:hypothetical protein GCM10010349_77300 [Streptomyces flavofungini]|nr:hypothetical protein GCM10010349_77300 [Streptomyces flavofungini]